MIGVSVAMTAFALEPRSLRASVASLFRTRLMAALLGVISSLRPYRRTVNPRKSNPALRGTMRVLSSLKTSPRGASHSTSRALTCSACSWL
jgi:hypothetical protein